tara:strand:+ start:378 stop:587 length:210 start_codon:yes stop_codon:yes gene_type:complete
MNKSTTIDGYTVELDQDEQLWIEKDGRFYGSGAGLENTGTLNDRDGYTPHYVSEETQDKIFAWEEKHTA